METDHRIKSACRLFEDFHSDNNRVATRLGGEKSYRLYEVENCLCIVMSHNNFSSVRNYIRLPAPKYSLEELGVNLVAIYAGPAANPGDETRYKYKNTYKPDYRRLAKVSELKPYNPENKHWEIYEEVSRVLEQDSWEKLYKEVCGDHTNKRY